MRQLSRAFRLALLLVLPLAAPLADSLQAAASFDTPRVPQEQNKPSAEALAEASQLSLTVVRLFNEGKYEEALPLAKRALELRETALGPDHELVQGALFNLAEIYSATKRYGEAQKLVERLLKTHEQSAGPEDAGVAVLLDRLAYLTYAQRDFKKTEATYKRALAIREKAFGQDHAEYAKSLFALAEFYRFTGKFEDAQPLYEQAALLQAKLLGRENPEYLKTRDRYFCLAYETGDLRPEKKLKDFAEKLGDTSESAKGIIGSVLNGRAISLPRPSYPEEARRGYLQGVVVIKVTIDELGQVIEAEDMCGGNPLLVKPSLQAARAARFTATRLAGQTVKVTGVVTYRFVAR